MAGNTAGKPKRLVLLVIMRMRSPGIFQLQLLVWLAVLLLIFFSLLPMDGFGKSMIYTAVNTTSYAIIIYGNILILYPAFYKTGKFVSYGLLVTLLLLATGILRGYASITLYQYFLSIKKTPINFWTLKIGRAHV